VNDVSATDPQTPTGAIPEAPEITRSTRDPEELRTRMESWLRGHVPGAEVGELTVPGNGMSSETVLFDVEVTDSPSATPERLALAARLSPTDDAVPVFPSYDLEAQYRVMELVGRHTAAPVPHVRWYEPDASVLGTPFFVMDRVSGRVPPDVMPYTIDGYMLDAGEDQLAHMQSASVGVLADIHRTPLGEETAFLEFDRPGDTALRRHVEHWTAYMEWVKAGRDLPVLDAALAWLEDHWPEAADARPPALSWGDARVGNMMYDGFTPVAVFDWEMAGIAPVEVDLGWMTYLHTFFQDITVDLGLPGLPGFMDADVAGEQYREASGVDIDDLHWFRTYAAFRHGAIMVRITDRQVHFGDAEAPADPEDAIIHRPRLVEMISH
jgi:aminoglycoside phosphotransferase (APT) family kinase protein